MKDKQSQSRLRQANKNKAKRTSVGWLVGGCGLGFGVG